MCVCVSVSLCDVCMYVRVCVDCVGITILRLHHAGLGELLHDTCGGVRYRLIRTFAFHASAVAERKQRQYSDGRQLREYPWAHDVTHALELTLVVLQRIDSVTNGAE